MLILFAFLRTRAQRFLTHALFLRSSPDRAAAKLREIAASVHFEPDYIPAAAAAIAEFFSASHFEVIEESADGPVIQEKAIAVIDPARDRAPNWVQSMAPLRFSRGDGRLLLLGSRRGGRRYLSEDLEMLDRLTAAMSEQVERIRSSEMQALVSQAELRALQAQINPHFFFNALNTLYGTIARENSAARRLVQNLAGLFRYSFAVSSGLSPLEEEIRIVRAYLEIEELRLGSRLATEFDIDDSVLSSKVPVLSIQPLVENAVKYGVASRHGSGFVRLSIRRRDDSIVIAVSNSGVFGESAPDQGGHGIGMANVRRRLALCYGTGSNLEVTSTNGMTTVRFLVPAAREHEVTKIVA
jgi:hypothetical protein